MQHDGPNPWGSARIHRLLSGVTRTAPRHAGGGPTLAITPDLLARLVRDVPSALIAPDTRSRMRYAAVMTAAHAGLRPSELLGSAVHRERALLVTDIAFYETPASTRAMPLLPPHTSADHTVLPDRFEITLGVSKADQAGDNPPIPIAAPLAVRALWVWLHVRREAFGEADARVFIERTLSRIVGLGIRPLCTHIADALDLAGIPHPRITGKAFRRGCASALTAAGVATSVIAATLRHRTLSMQDRYSDAASKAARVLAASRAIGATPAAARL